MKKLSVEAKERLSIDYNPNWYNAMTDNIELVNDLLEFIERHSKYSITYPQAFFSLSKIDVYQYSDEIRLFNHPNSVFGLVPLSEEYAKGDWSEWLKNATIVEELR